MIIAQVLLDGASQYERKSQRLDQAALSIDHDVRVGDVRSADLVHIYAPPDFEPSILRDLTVPWVSNARPRLRRFRRKVLPDRVLTPLNESPDAFIPEAVEDCYFAPATAGTRSGRAIIGSYARPSIQNVVASTASRIQRTREDVDWLLFDGPPTPDDLRGVDVWVDPATTEDDFDGFVAEALVSGAAVVASRTLLNTQRLERGRTGVLVPPRDANEWTHAILALLFKHELRQTKVSAARQTASKFRSRQRSSALTRLYQSILQ